MRFFIQLYSSASRGPSETAELLVLISASEPCEAGRCAARAYRQKKRKYGHVKSTAITARTFSQVKAHETRQKIIAITMQLETSNIDLTGLECCTVHNALLTIYLHGPVRNIV